MTLPRALGVSRLSEQHLATLLGTANGLSSRQIASRSRRSVASVNSDFRVIRAVLGVDSRAQAVAVALRLGVIGLDAVVLPGGVRGSRDPSAVSGTDAVDRNSPEKESVRPSAPRTRLARTPERTGD